MLIVNKFILIITKSHLRNGTSDFSLPQPTFLFFSFFTQQELYIVACVLLLLLFNIFLQGKKQSAFIENSIIQ